MEETRFQKIEKLKKQEKKGNRTAVGIGLGLAALCMTVIAPPVGFICAVISVVGAGMEWSHSKTRATEDLKKLGYSGQQSNNSYGNEDSRGNKNNKVHNEPENKEDVEAGKKATMKQEGVKDAPRRETKNGQENRLVKAVENIQAKNKNKDNTLNR